MQNKVITFLTSKKDFPVLAAIAVGLYPLLYYYDLNFALINSKSQFVFFVCSYIIIPLIAFCSLHFLSKKINFSAKAKAVLSTIFSITFFLVFIVITLFGFNFIKLLLALVIGLLLGFILYKHRNKVILFQLILAFLILPKLIPDIYREVFYSDAWMQQPDAIEQTVFKKKPNVYVIQPDGYVNFSELNNRLYNFDNHIFEGFLKENKFTFYPKYRSNYTSTLSSNSSLFGMKHHYYGNSTLGINPSHNSRNEIVEDNPVLRTFKNNNYKTFLLLQTPYLLVNRPKIDFDFCNISLDEVSYIARGFSKDKDLSKDVKTAIQENKNTSNFFFIESMLPSHIITHDNPNNNIEKERELYLKRLQKANIWLTDLITYISNEDKDAIVLIVSDHGGYVGLSSMLQNEAKQTDRDIVYSMFSAALAIKWNDTTPEFDSELQSSVNLFRTLFSYLSEDDSLLKNLQPNESFTVIRRNNPKGVFKLIDEEGAVVYKALKNK
ncbi:sulfatase-like hydrolase/transferase [Lacinutrix sp. C3R15]|uniref:sulfatase-like hydrolase/transferase n=1 Tax=Flavobacteriaceae TaxID=49546 RepID=UPI001C0A4064|nr:MULTISPECIES: sulfatase-like hydrolase/transferase [Flavobacteriaceae]MBU2939663.1 sulfatase-like hydrolase/transferase [Lacinutrix sp. C3R15]MDO6622978.1 sulfatase-like hydrolase/transferase [Oceanihabitans sp. 1_MG-2023]